MEKHAYCTGCGRYVTLTGEVCPAGHGGDSLRDVRSGALPVEVARRQSERPGAMGTGGVGAGTTHAGAAGGQDSAESIGRVLGWLVVLVPALGLGVIMVAMTEPQYVGMGLGSAGAWFAAVATVALTLGAALAWGWLRFVRKRR
jgi:hypothetical protein